MPTPPLTPPNYQPPGGKTSQPLQPRPLQPRTPNLVQPTTAPGEVPTASPDATDAATPGQDSAPTLPKPSGPRRKCPNCLYFPMKPLADFKDEDIEKAYVGEAFVPNSAFSFFAPFLSLFIIITTALGNVFFAKAKDAKSRAKVRRARSEILARNPNSLICPECCEVLEIL